MSALRGFDDRQLLKDPANRSPFLDKKLVKFGQFFKDRKRVLEIGCGWGEFQLLLRGLGVASEAVELDPRRAAYVRGLKFPVAQADGRFFLKRAPKGRFDGLFMSNVIEHMSVQDAKELLAQAALRLAPGAKLAITTANPKCLGVMTDTFWNDMEHTRPFPLAMMAEMLQDLGFTVLKAEADEDSRPQSPLRWLLRRSRTLLVGPYFEASEIYVMAQKG